MEKIKITFLGTSSTIPTITRNHSSIHLKYKEKNILIDCGEGTQRQLRIAKINPCKITDILITHFHGDHIFGIPGLLHSLARNDYTGTLNIYGPKGIKQLIKKIKEITPQTKELNLNIQEAKGKFIETPYFQITAIPLEHGVPTNGYMFEEKDRLRIKKDKIKKLKIQNTPDLKKLVEGKDIIINKKKIKSKDLTFTEKGRKISISLDTKLCSNLKKITKDADLAIMEATFLSSKEMSKANQYKHLTLEEATKTAKQSKVKQLILTHFSQRNEFKGKLLSKTAKKIFQNTIIAKDFLEIEV